MAEPTWKKHFWRNAFSNYLRTILRLKRARHILQVENPAEGRDAPGSVSRKKQLLPFVLGQLASWRP